MGLIIITTQGRYEREGVTDNLLDIHVALVPNQMSAGTL